MEILSYFFKTSLLLSKNGIGKLVGIIVIICVLLVKSIHG